MKANIYLHRRGGLPAGVRDVGIHDNFNSGQVVVSDSTGVTIGAGCTAVSGNPNSANCGGPSLTAVVADLGNGNNKWTDNEVTNWDNLQQFSVTTGSGADNIQGHSFNVPYTVRAGGGDDTMSFTLNTTVNHLFGEDGNDTITGGGGNDVIDGGNGDDNIDGWSGNDTIDGCPGNDTITGDDRDDAITGGPGMDSIHGDVTCCSPGNDTGARRAEPNPGRPSTAAGSAAPAGAVLISIAVLPGDSGSPTTPTARKGSHGPHPDPRKARRLRPLADR